MRTPTMTRIVARTGRSTLCEILADNKLRKVFGKDKVTMFEMNKHLTQHLKTTPFRIPTVLENSSARSVG